ncbi:hypothetical protein Leryth_022266 [Lithospermum erythrorhizon]|nr:hypothetical protein Leryth_022266 [Lithospermum erythrorhizon]
MTPGFVRGRFKRKANSRELSGEDDAAKRRILELSASAACKSFQKLHEKPCGLDLGTSPATSEIGASLSSLSSLAGSDANVGLVHEVEGNLDADDGKLATAKNVTDESILKIQRDLKNISKYCETKVNLIFMRDPYLCTLDRLGKASNSSIKGVTSTKEHIKYDENKKWGNSDSIGSYVNTISEASRLEELEQESQGSALESQDEDTSSDSNSIKMRQPPSPISLKSIVYSTHRNISELWSSLINGPVRTLNGYSPGAESIVAELVELIDEQPMGFDRSTPVVLDSVYFKGGSLMLLAYGDREPREMENAATSKSFRIIMGEFMCSLLEVG